MTQRTGQSSSGSDRPLFPGRAVILYGRNPVREAVRGRRPVQRIWAAAAAGQGWAGKVPVQPAQEAELEALCGSPDHQGVCAQVAPYPYVLAHELLDAPDAIVLCLDQVQDPHNLGAVCRVAECAGVAGVVVPERRSAAITPAVCKASAGAVEHLRVARVRNVADYLSQAKAAGAWVYGASGAGAGAVSYTEPDYRGRLVLVLGSEGEGLRPRVASACDALVALPLRGRIESLNVSTAAAALVYGILHLRSALDRAP